MFDDISLFIYILDKIKNIDSSKLSLSCNIKTLGYIKSHPGVQYTHPPVLILCKRKWKLFGVPLKICNDLEDFVFKVLPSAEVFDIKSFSKRPGDF